MNYHIQGDAANADKIKAAFERNGIDTSANSNYGISNLFYFSCNGEVAVTQNGSIINLIKTHPDYKELKLPIQPKFKVGDWITNGTFTHCIVSIVDGFYYFHGGGYLDFGKIDGYYHLWSIADAKDGDIIGFNDCTHNDGSYTDWVGIYKQRTALANQYLFHCVIPSCRTFRFDGMWRVFTAYPATKEQRDLLFAKMKEAGYQWDADKKELRKIQPHYDISNFHAGMPVLVRDSDNDNDEWAYTYFSHITDNGDFNTGGWTWKQCIPFDGNEHLLGTTDMCDEMYINW